MGAMLSTSIFRTANPDAYCKAADKAFESAKKDTTRYWFVVSNDPDWGYDITFAGPDYSDAKKLAAGIELTPGCGYGYLHIEIKRLNWLLWYYRENLDKVAVDLMFGGEARDLYAEVFGEPLN